MKWPAMARSALSCSRTEGSLPLPGARGSQPLRHLPGRKTLDRIEQGRGRSGHHGRARDLAHGQMMADALVEIEGWIEEQREIRRQIILELLRRIRDEQIDYEQIKWGRCGSFMTGTCCCSSMP